ncbi:hypothetical protein ACH5RR_015448 [Cinchona calisaya]|uniref:Uncharacterized protein n=1 Tax=Cinchona calisaya TaxID=153742 RepID=A0ABD2ZT91_9GENT
MQENNPVSPTLEQTQKSAKANERSFSLFMLFMYADGVDILLMVFGSMCAIGNGLSQPIMAILFGGLVDTFNAADHQHMIQEVLPVSFKMLYLAIGAGIAALLQVLCWTITGRRQATRLQDLYLKSLLRQEIAFFDTEMTMGQVIGMTSSDAIIIQEAISDKMGKSIQLMSTFLGGFLFAFARGWFLSLVLCSMIPSLVIVGGITTTIISKMSIHQQVASSEARDIVEETVGAIRTVSSLTAEKEAIVKYAKKLKRVHDFSMRQGLVSGVGLGIVSFIVFSGYGLAIWYGSKLILEKDYKGGQVISILIALVYSGMALGQSSSCVNALALGQAAASKMFETIERKSKIDPDDSSGIIIENIKGEIEFKHVYFRYPARPNSKVFSGLSLHIPSGTHMALVGKSGSGKSTIINLLERFYDPDAGEVLIDGINVKKLQLRWLREKIGLVSQEPVLFATTIRENILYGKENATEDEINKALEISSAAAFINDLPQGLDTMVGKRGAQLSGGQKQRIAIARLIVKDPKIFLLDEVTSALDIKTEKATYSEIFKISSRLTTIIVTHNLSSVENVDSIAVMHQGKIVEQGTHEELIRDKDGHYSKLFFTQEKNEDESSKQLHGESSMVNETVDKFDDPLSFTQSFASKSSSSTTYSFGRSGNISARVSCMENERKRENTYETYEKHRKVSVEWLANLSKDVFPVLLVGTISAIVHGVAFPIFGFLFSTAIKTFYEPPSVQKKDSSHWALMYVVLGIITFLAVLAQNYSFGAASSKLIKRLSLLSFENIVNQKICWFDDPSNSSGAVVARLSNDASTLQSLLSNGLALLVQNMATVIAGLLIAFMENWMLALILVALLSLLALQSLFETKLLKRFATHAELMHVEQSQVASDAIGSIRTVTSICAENKVIDLYKEKSGTKMMHWIRLGIIRSLVFGISQFAFYSTNALCFYIGAILVQLKTTTVPELFKVYLALIASAAGITEASAMALDIKKATALASSICTVFANIQRNNSSKMGITVKNIVGDIEFKSVSFAYPSRPNVKVLKDISLSISAGKTVVFVGESGNGKSTLISLVERFYNVSSGCILLDAIEIRKYNVKWLRQHIGLVSQEPILFNDTIRSNIAYGKEEDTIEDEIVKAAKLANAHNFISSLPEGYNTFVGQCGVQLSGGQKQRIAIARAIVKYPKILLLDEATSSLDADSEKVVQDALNQVMVSKTTMVVTHRLSTIRETDTIAFLRNGVIVEKGRHDELIKIAQGAYASLFAHHLNHST